MIIIERNIIYKEDYVVINVIGEKYNENVLLDYDDISYYNKICISNNGYATFNCKLLHRLILNCEKEYDVDHINGNRLDDRKCNLRKVSKSINERNKHSFRRNNTGFIGIQYRENKNYKYYRVSWRDIFGKRYTKQFNINYYGKDLAFNIAKSFLLEKYDENKYLTHNH